MATWVRQGTGTAPSNTDSDLVGEYALDNATAPVDFDPAAVNSVRCQWSVTGSGFTDDSWNDDKGCAVVTSGGTEVSQHPGGGPNGLQNTTESNDHTDSTGIPTGLSTAEWESVRVRGDGTVVPNEWVTWVKNKAADGSTLAVSALTVTIDYTPAGDILVPSTLNITPTFPTAELTGGANITTLERSVSAGADDGYRDEASGGTWNNTGTTLIVGFSGFVGVCSIAMRFLNITIDQGATISSASFDVVATGSDGTLANVATIIRANDTDDAAQIADATDFNGRARTTASTLWDPGAAAGTWTTGDVKTSPDIAAVIQEVIDRPGWVSGNDIIIFWEDDGTSQTENTLISGAAEENTTYVAPKLTISYSTSSGDTLEPTVLSITPSFPTATVAPGTVALTPALLSITPTFGTAEIKRISYFEPALLSVASTFPTATLSSEATITPAPLSVAVSLPTASVDSLATIVPALLLVSPTFGTAEIKESVNLVPSLLTVTATFGTATLIQEQFLEPSSLTVTTNFGTANIFSDLFLEPTLLTISTTFPAGQLNQAFTSNLLTPTITIFTPGIKEVQAVQPSLLTVAFTLHTAQLNQNVNPSTHQVIPTFGTATLGLFIQPALLGVTPTLGTAQVSSTYDITPATVTPTVAFGAAEVEGAGTTQDVQPASLSVVAFFPASTLTATATLTSSVVGTTASFGTATLVVALQPAMLTVTPAFGNAQLDFGIEDDAVLTVGTTFPTATVIGDQGLSPDVVNVTVVFPVGNLANAGTPLTPFDTEGQGIAQEMCAARGLSGDLDYLGCLNALNGGSDLDKLGALTALGATPGADLLLALEQLANDGLGKADFNELMRRWAESGNF